MIGDNNFWDKRVDKGMDLAYNSDSDDEDYRGDVYDDDYSDDGKKSLAKYCVPSAWGKGAAAFNRPQENQFTSSTKLVKICPYGLFMAIVEMVSCHIIPG